ncbi:MAG TPA: ABC transporter permease [Cellulomonas sp.]
MNATYLRIDLVRQLRDGMYISFVVALPVLMYILFGTAFGASGDAVGRGDTRFYVMTAMAAYGASIGATAIAASAAMELLQGWGRQLALTPLRPGGFVATKVVVALAISGIGALAVTVVGFATGAHAGPPWVWPATFVITWLGSSLFALYGLVVAQLFHSESAIGVASASLVIWAFFGNLFVPLSGTVLQIARWTPMYGYAGLARWPQMQGHSVADGHVDPLWSLVLGFVAWALVFAALATWAVRRGRGRQ